MTLTDAPEDRRSLQTPLEPQMKCTQGFTLQPTASLPERTRHFFITEAFYHQFVRARACVCACACGRDVG